MEGGQTKVGGAFMEVWW